MSNNFIDIEDRHLTVAQMLSSPPDGLGPREWFVNVDEVARTVSYPVTGYVEEVVINGTSKLVLRDDGPGMSPTPKKGVEFDLTTFVSKIAASGASKINTLDGNQGRGFRLAWSAHNTDGIIVLSQVMGGDVYEAKWWFDTGTERWRYAEPVLAKKPLVDLKGHGTAFIMLGHDAQHDTVAEPFDGWEDYRKSGTLFASLLTRRIDKPKADCRVLAKGMLVGEGNNNASKAVNFFGRDTSTVMTPTLVKIQKSDITLEWIEHEGKRFKDRRRSIFGGTDMAPFATIVFEGEMFDFCEGDAEWKYIAEIMGDIGLAADTVSVRIHLGKSWKNRVKQSFDRTRLEWKTGMRDMKRPCRRGKAYGASVVAIATFQSELTDALLWPKFLKDLVVARKQEIDDSVDDKHKRRWEKELEKYRLRLKPKGKGHQRTGEPYIFPLPGAPDTTGDDGDNFFDTGAILHVEIKPLSGDHETRYPVLFRHDVHTKEWTMSLSIKSDYVVKALNVGAAAYYKGNTEYAQLEPHQMTPVRTAVQNAAAYTLGRHFLFVQMHLKLKHYNEEDVEKMLVDQPGATGAMQHYFDWIDTIPIVVKDYKTLDEKSVA